jgi:DNA topoisomerase I
MPRKQKKSKEEKITEEYFPINEDDLRWTIEKQIKKEIPKEVIIKNTVEKIMRDKKIEEDVARRTVEKIYNKPSIKELEKIEKIRKKKVTKRKSNSNKKDYSPPKISLKKGGYELIITEKPQAANKIALALGKAEQKNYNKISYYQTERNGKKILVACAVGHLFTLKQNKTGSEIPNFDISWTPNFLVRKKDFTKRYFDTILKITKNAGEITIATDFDIEGEVIGLNVMRFICNQPDASRMKFSTLTKDEIINSYENKFSHIDWGQAIAGETRHYLDWFYGINLSRALMSSIKTTGRFRIMSIGRVQGPTLNLIVQKENKIKSFKPEKYWQIFIRIKNFHEVELIHNKDIFKKEDLKKFESLLGKTADAKTEKKEQSIPPNTPFNLTDLQTEAYRIHKISPSNTLKAAQSLYLSSLISYPRTSSQKLPESINYKEILKNLSKIYNTEKLIKRKKPIEGKKSDSAHPSIYPTGNQQILSGNEEKIYNLIVKRFIALFCEDAVIENKKISLEIDKLKFSTKGFFIKNRGWTEIYPSRFKEKKIPDMNGEVKIIKVRNEEKETQPPKRYTPASLISELEKKNLGTKATRAMIIETLYDRNYIKGQSIEATPLGISLINTLEEFSPIIIDEVLTRQFEKNLENIRESKKDFEKKKERIIEKAKETIINISKDFKKNEKKIGERLLRANTKLEEQQREENKLNICPLCKKGRLEIKYSRKNRKYFVACDAYPECKNTYSLPPNGVIKKTDKICEFCGFPMLMRLTKGRRPWIFCFNSECSTNKERIKKYREKEENNSKPLTQ